MTRRVQTARLNGSLGGKQCSQSLTEDQREQRARNAGVALLTRYGKDYYAHIGKQAHHPKHDETKEKKLEPIKLSVSARRIAAALG